VRGREATCGRGLYACGDMLTDHRTLLRDLRTGARGVLEHNHREGTAADGVEFAYTCPDNDKYPDRSTGTRV